MEDHMPDPKIERVDSLPLILSWLKKMGIQEAIDSVFAAHTNWQGLSYGQLAVLFITYVLYTCTHRLSGMEEWIVSHQITLEEMTGWTIRTKEATDDRVGHLLEMMGKEEEQMVLFQRQVGEKLIRAYDLPTEIVRYDTTSFSVYHGVAEEGEKKGLLNFGHSKDHRSDLLQFKQGLGSLDPAGVPLFSNTVAGQTADDPLYLPAWREMSKTIGHTHFLYVADCKAAALATRTTIDHEQGFYLFPLPMTGGTPDLLRQWVLSPPGAVSEVYLPEITDKQGKPVLVGHGFSIERAMQATLEDGSPYTWIERWLVTQSLAHAQRQRTALQDRLTKTTTELSRLKAKTDETLQEYLSRAERILHQRQLVGLLTVTAVESITTTKQYENRGRPGSDSPYTLVEERHLHLDIHPDQTAIQEQLDLAGWRIYVTNVPATRMSLEQAMAYYRDEWLVEHGFHRFKKGCLPALPLFLRLDERIRGLMFLLMIALQALTLLEFVAQRQLKADQTTIAGLVPGNPKMKTDHPSAERILAQFDGLHLFIEETDTLLNARMIERLSPLQQRLLAILDIPQAVYALNFSFPLSKNPRGSS
jgi:transposase